MKRIFSCDSVKSDAGVRGDEKEKIELYLRRTKYRFRRTLLLFVFGAFISIASVLIAVYATYVFIDVTRISDIANVHISKSVKLFFRTIGGGVFNNPQSGINNWMLHRDRENGFEIAHPEEWVTGEGEEHLLEIKKFNSRRSIDESLAAVIFVDKMENNDGLDLFNFAAVETGLPSEILKRFQISGKDAVRTGKQKDSSGLSYSKIFWEKGGNNYCLKVVYYNQQSKDTEADLEKILANMKLL